MFGEGYAIIKQLFWRCKKDAEPRDTENLPFQTLNKKTTKYIWTNVFWTYWTDPPILQRNSISVHSISKYSRIFQRWNYFHLFFLASLYFFCHCWRVGRNFPSCTFLIRLHNSKPTRNQGCSKGCVKHFNLMGFVRDRDWNGRKNLLKNYNIQCCSSNSQRHIIVK